MKLAGKPWAILTQPTLPQGWCEAKLDNERPVSLFLERFKGKVGCKYHSLSITHILDFKDNIKDIKNPMEKRLVPSVSMKLCSVRVDLCFISQLLSYSGFYRADN